MAQQRTAGSGTGVAGRGVVPERAADHYHKTHYWSDLRVQGYANQLAELYRLDPENALEVGVADGFISEVVARFTHHRLVSLDVDPALRPGVSGSVLDLPFADGAFDMVMCCQVLEHLPFSQFERAVSELRRVARRTILLSLPDVRRFVSIRVRLPRLGWRDLSLSLERRSLGPFEFDGDHHWEIGFEGTRFRDVSDVLGRAGVRVRRCYRLPELPYHCCFLLDP